MEYYLKVEKDICPNCKELREVVIQYFFTGNKYNEVLAYRIGYKCDSCGAKKYAQLKNPDVFVF